MTRFDPDPDRPYGSCKTCGIELPTQEEGYAHMLKEHHTILGTNLPREDRLINHVESLVYDAMVEVADQIWADIARGDMTLDEAIEAASDYDDLVELIKEDQ